MALESANQTIRWLQRIGITVVGLTGNTAIAAVFDYIVYPWLLISYGLFGWVYASCAAILLDVGCLWFYNLTKQDWLGIETIKLVRDNPAASRLRTICKTILQRSDVMAFLYLSIRHNPFITVVYLRHGSGNYEMTGRDWKIFWASVVVSNLAWGLVIFGVIEMVEMWATWMPTI